MGISKRIPNPRGTSIRLRGAIFLLRPTILLRQRRQRRVRVRLSIPGIDRLHKRLSDIRLGILPRQRSSRRFLRRQHSIILGFARDTRRLGGTFETLLLAPLAAAHETHAEDGDGDGRGEEDRDDGAGRPEGGLLAHARGVALVVGAADQTFHADGGGLGGRDTALAEGLACVWASGLNRAGGVGDVGHGEAGGWGGVGVGGCCRGRGVCGGLTGGEGHASGIAGDGHGGGMAAEIRSRGGFFAAAEGPEGLDGGLGG